jgi:hypothetical protein
MPVSQKSMPLEPKINENQRPGLTSTLTLRLPGKSKYKHSKNKVKGHFKIEAKKNLFETKNTYFQDIK